MTTAYVPRPRTASKTCPDVSVRRPGLLLLMSHDKDFFGGSEGIHMEVRDVGVLIEMLTLAKHEDARRGKEDAVLRRKSGLSYFDLKKSAR